MLYLFFGVFKCIYSARSSGTLLVCDFRLNQIFLIKISPNFFLFLGHIYVLVMWSGVLMKSMTSKWSSLIFLMAAPLSWLMNNCGPWSSQVIMSISLHTIYTHIHTRTSAISAMVQMHYYNYQSAPQPPNSEYILIQSHGIPVTEAQPAPDYRLK